MFKKQKPMEQVLSILILKVESLYRPKTKRLPAIRSASKARRGGAAPSGSRSSRHEPSLFAAGGVCSFMRNLSKQYQTNQTKELIRMVSMCFHSSFWASLPTHTQMTGKLQSKNEPILWIRLKHASVRTPKTQDF